MKGKKLRKLNKTICDFDKKDFDKFGQEIKKIIMEPKYMCRKCYRASSVKDLLCKPTKI